MSVRKSVAWAFLGQFVSITVTFAGSVVIARILSPTELGVYVLAVAVMGILQIITAFGAAAYVVRETELTPRVMDTAFTVNALLAVALAACVFAISFVSEPLLGTPDAGNVLKVLALGPLLAILTFRPAAMLQREMQFKTLALIASAASITYTAITVGFAYAGASYMSPAFGALASSIFQLAAFNLVGLRYNSLRLSLVDWRPMTVFGLRMMSISGISVLMYRLSDIVVGRLLGIAALGLLSRATNISNLLFENIYGTATRVVFAKLARDNRERGEIREGFLHGYQLITGVMAPLLIGIAVLARPAIYILYGEKWLGAAAPLSIMLIGQLINLSFGMNWELFVLRDETARQTRLELTRSVLALTLLVIGCAFGLVGATLGGVVTAVISTIIYFPHMTRLAETPAREFLIIYRNNALLAVAAAAPAAALMTATGWSAETPLAWIAGAVVLGIALWLAAIVWLRHPIEAELRMLSKRLPVLRRA